MGIFQFLVGVVVLALGIPIGDLLKHFTKDETKQGQVWFKWITILGLIGAFLGLVIENDIILFSFAFISIVTSRNLNKN